MSLVAGTIGGLMIGAGAGLMLFGRGRIAGISGMLATLVTPEAEERNCAAMFVAGLVLGAALMNQFGFGGAVTLTQPSGMLLTAGLLVGIGARWANGCTSGHGICGLGRLSRRSFTATGVFMLTAAVTVYFVRHGLGG